MSSGLGGEKMSLEIKLRYKRAGRKALRKMVDTKA